MTPYSEVNEIIARILSSLQSILGAKLVGFYLCGSLVIGDFDLRLSDIDLTAALASNINEQEFASLQKMHTDVALQHPKWDNRIEVRYISLADFNSLRSRTGQIAIISPGEPFHMRESLKEWLSEWYLLRERGVTLYGPPPRKVIEPISHDDFMQTIKAHARAWGEWVLDMHTRKGQSYAILTMCRALYTSRNGEQVSKKQAALWAQQQLPEWSRLIRNALKWREESAIEQVDDDATFAETKRFVDVVRDLILQ